MAISQQTTNYLKKAREEGPAYFQKLPDEVLYRKLKRQDAVPSDASWSEMDARVGITPKPLDQQELDRSNDINTLQQYADLWIDDDSYDWVKAAYNRSLTGNVETLMTGEQRYNVDETDFNLLEDIGSSLLSFIMPLDFFTMWTGGLAGKGLSGLMANGMKKKITQKAAAAGLADDAVLTLTKTQSAILGAAGQAPALAAYEGAMGGVQAALHGEDVMSGVTHGVLHGGFLGAITGGIGGGLGAAQAKLLQRGKQPGKALSGFEKFRAYGVYGMPGQILSESTVFTAAGAAQRFADAAKNGEDVDANDILRDFAHNVGMFGFLKTKQKLMKRGKDTLKEIRDAMREQDAAKSGTNNTSKDKNQKVKDTIENDPDISRKNKDEINSILDKANLNIDKELKSRESEIAKVEAELEAIGKVLEKTDVSKDGAKKLTADVHNNIKKVSQALENYLKGNNVTPENEALHSSLDKRVLKLKKEFNELDVNIDKKWEIHLKNEGKIEKAHKVFGWDLKTAKEKSMELDVSEINAKAKEFNLNVEGKLADKASRDKVIERIFQLDKAEFDKKVEIARATGTGGAEDIIAEIRQITGKKDIKEVELDVYKQETLKKTEKSIPKVKESNVSDTHKNILAYTLDVAPKKVAHSKGSAETLKLFEYIESKYKRNINELTKTEKEQAIKDYIHKEIGLDIYNTTQAELNKRFGTDSPQGLREYRAIQREADRIRDSLGEIFTRGKMGELLGVKDIISNITRMNVPGARKPTIVGGEAGFKKWIEFVESKPEGIEYSKNKKISSEEASLAIELASHKNALLRPGELVNVKASHINAQTGEIKIIRQKVKGQKQEVDYIVDKGLAERLQNLADSKGIKGERRLFSFESAKDVNNFAKYLAKNSGTEVLVEHQVLGETFKWDDVIPGSKGVADIKAGKGLEYGRAFRGLYEGEILTEKGKIEQTQSLGQKLPHVRLHYKRKTIPLKEKQQKISPERMKEKIDTGIEVQEKQKQYFESIPAYSNLQINLGKKLGKNKGETVLGKIRGHVIKIAEGKVKLDTLPHEVSHYVTDVLKQFGTAKDKSLINRGINLFSKGLKRKKNESKESFRERQEELLVQRIGELAAGQITNRTMMSKFKSWVKAVNSRMKEFFGIANKDDIAFILSRRVVKGNIPKGVRVKNFIDGLDAHYQKVNNNLSSKSTKEVKNLQKQYNKAIHKIEQELRDSGIKQEELNGIREMKHLDPPGSGRKAEDVSIATYESWMKELELVRAEIPKLSKKESLIEAHATKHNVIPEELSALTVMLGEPSGNANNLSGKGRAYLRELITTHGKVDKFVETSGHEMSALGKVRMPYIQKIAKAFMPAFHVIRKYGGEPGRKLADRILKFDVLLHTKYKGEGDKAVHEIKKLVGLNGQKHVWLFDKARVEKYVKDGNKLTKAEEKFVKEINKEGSNVNLAFKSHEKLMEFYWNGLQSEVSRITNRAEFEQFKSEFSQKFVSNYFSRKLTKKAHDFLIKNKETEHIENLVNEHLKKVASKEAVEYAKKIHGLEKTPHKKNKENASYNETYKNRYEKNMKDKKIKSEMADDIMFMLTHNHSKVKNRYLLDRGPLLPEFIEITKPNGQKQVVRTYESHLRNTVEPYIMAMSKYLATLRYFPEYTGLGGRYKIGSSKLLELQTFLKDKTLGNYAKETVERLIGVHKENLQHSIATDALGTLAHFSAAAGLSSPTSGIKNMLIGVPRSIASYGLLNTGRGVLKLFSRNTWDDARKKGTLEFGSKTMELGMTPGGIMHKLFKFNLMTQTENMNRIISTEAGKLYFSNQLNILRGHKGIFGESGVKNSRRLMRDQWKLSDEWINFLEKGNHSTNEGAKKLSEIIKHVEFYSHASAQGTTSIGQVPLWASGRIGKPLTLFQRMAYSTTWDSYRNYFRPAIKHGNVAPLARALMAHTASGIALYGMYQWLFDKEPPESAGTAGDKMSMYLWRSEFLGLFGSILSPYDEGTFQNLADPVIVRNTKEGGIQTYKWLTGSENFVGAANQWLKRSIVAYNQWDTFGKVQGSKPYSEMLVMNNWEKQFKGEFNIKTSSQEIYSTRTPYYRDLKQALWFGDEKKIEKAYMAAYNYLVTDIIRGPGQLTSRAVHKKAISALEKSISYMRPVKFTSESRPGVVKTPEKEYLEWVLKNFGKKGIKRIREQQYQFRLIEKKLAKLIRNKKLWQEKSVWAKKMA